jgi:hypothetical protein
LFLTLCDNITAFCTSYNGVNICVGFSLYIKCGIQGIYDVKMYYLLSSIFTGSHNCYKNVTFIFVKDGKQCFVLLFNLMQLSDISFYNIVYLFQYVWPNKLVTLIFVLE